MLVSFSKSLQNSKLEQEHKQIQKDCILHSFQKEHNQNNYLKKLNVLNGKTGEIKMMGDYSSQINKRSHNHHQKSSTIVNLGISEGLVPIFITLTLPSGFHPFISKKTKKRTVFYKNKNFEFETISQSIKDGYKLLNQVHRNFYKRVFELHNGDKFYYINSTEYHKSFIPHTHLLVFVKRELVEDVINIFENQKRYYKLSRTDFQVIDNEFSIDVVSSYIRKYMFKNLILNDDDISKKSSKITQSRFMDGYLKIFKFRQFKMTNLKLTLDVFNKVYHSLDRDFKDKIIEKITPLKKSLFQFIMENIKVQKRVLDLETNKRKLTQFSLNSSKKLFEVFIDTVKTVKKSTVVKYLIFQREDNLRIPIYNKQDFQVLIN